ncbi:MAG TPA: NYN domain-containing protein [Myxococcota bacterium]|nr:NYN domain-containing protein [Myxococcota bacterium]
MPRKMSGTTRVTAATGESREGSGEAERPSAVPLAEDRVEALRGGAEGRRRPDSRRTILVDGFNVLHAVLLGRDRADGWWRRALRERLLDRVTSWTGGEDEIWVAFDGARPARSVWAEPVATPSEKTAGERGKGGPTVHSVFVESADDWIVRRARRAERPEGVVVVSADRKVAGRARSAGCEVLTPWAFIERCPAPEGHDEIAQAEPGGGVPA